MPMNVSTILERIFEEHPDLDYSDKWNLNPDHYRFKFWRRQRFTLSITDKTSLNSKIYRTSDLTDFQNAVACKGYTSVLSKMVSVIFAVLGVSF